MTTGPDILVCRDAARMTERAARLVTAAAGAAIHARGGFTIALSGGSTPRPLYEALAGAPWRDRIAWERVLVYWGDERCVPPDHEESNHRLARETLLDHVPVPGGSIHRIKGEIVPADAARDYETTLRRTVGSPRGGDDADQRDPPRLDLALQGLGPDGHTASLFPAGDAITEDDRLVVAVDASTTDVLPPEVDRISLTPPMLNAARRIVFLVAGEEKAAAVAAVLEGPRDPSRWPAQAIRAYDGETIWLLDTPAASRLEAVGSAEGAS